MKTNRKHAVIARIARRGLVLAALVAMMLCAAAAGQAQSNSPSGHTTPTAQGPAAQSPPNSANLVASPPVQTPANATQTAAVPPPARGPREGLTVHGHWTIEVRNADGSVDKHVEFENGICPSQVNAQGNTDPGGALALSLFATGNAVVGPWVIVLNPSAALNTNAGVPPGCPDPSKAGVLPISFPGGVALVQNIGFYGSANGTSTPVTGNGSFDEALFELCGYSCFTMGAPATPTSSSPTIMLSGTIPANLSNGGSIAAVATVNVLCPGSIATTATCPDVFPVSVAILTGTQLTSPITFLSTQSVAVSVTLSFSSN